MFKRHLECAGDTPLNSVSGSSRKRTGSKTVMEKYSFIVKTVCFLFFFLLDVEKMYHSVEMYFSLFPEMHFFIVDSYAFYSSCFFLLCSFLSSRTRV